MTRKIFLAVALSTLLFFQSNLRAEEPTDNPEKSYNQKPWLLDPGSDTSKKREWSFNALYGVTGGGTTYGGQFKGKIRHDTPHRGDDRFEVEFLAVDGQPFYRIEGKADLFPLHLKKETVRYPGESGVTEINFIPLSIDGYKEIIDLEKSAHGNLELIFRSSIETLLMAEDGTTFIQLRLGAMFGLVGNFDPETGRSKSDLIAGTTGTFAAGMGVHFNKNNRIRVQSSFTIDYDHTHVLSDSLGYAFNLKLRFETKSLVRGSVVYVGPTLSTDIHHLNDKSTDHFQEFQDTEGLTKLLDGSGVAGFMGGVIGISF